MLREFIVANRGEILAQARARVAVSSAPLGSETEVAHGLPVFLDQLGDALDRARLHEVVDHAEIHISAGHHGDDLYQQGLSLAQVVNSYGDLCQVITGLCMDRGATITSSEFQTMNLCLDDATAAAVTAFASRRERAITDTGTEQLGYLAHELRNALGAAMLAFASIKKGIVAPGGSTGAMLDRSHARLQALIDRSLADVRLEAGMLQMERVPVWEVIEEAEISGSTLAQSKHLKFSVGILERTVIVEADRSVLAAAIANLLQNAFKFTRPATTVKLRATSTTSRVLIEVEDECGGLPPGAAESLLRPFVQQGRDRSGLGLGLSICVKAAKTMGGELYVRDLPGEGCVFTIDLPKQPPPPTSIHDHRERRSDAEDGSGGKRASSK